MSTAINQQLPPPPAQWQNSDDTMHHWLQAKAEEDRRKQEEEKTRQETLRLEQRRVEQSMLRDSLQAGVPPHMVPLIFAGIGPSGFHQPILELAQQYIAQSPGTRGTAPQLPSLAPSHSHSQSQRRPPPLRRDSRSIPASPYAPSAPQAVPPPGVLLSQNLLSNSAAPPTPQSLGRPSISGGPGDPRSGSTPQIPTSVSQAQSVPINLSNVQYAPGSSVPASQASGKPDSHSRQSPPSLYFHHWVPPSQPHAGTPSGKLHQESPLSSIIPRRSDPYTSPGRKRKASGPHQSAPLPSSRLSESVHADVQTSRPGSPIAGTQHVGHTIHRRQASGACASYENRLLEHVELEDSGAKSNSRDAAPLAADTARVEKVHHTTQDFDRRRDLTLPESSDRYASRGLQAPYTSSLDTEPHDSDLESSPGPSPISRTPLESTQPSVTPGG
ncbi:hypothetical protein AOCH_004491 [Aspergillus ochraceoroseus]|nr:hypothetical protein AOCH_004491 [Aspergillus ochraceoroseus]